jgi:hypothetical protein
MSKLRQVCSVAIYNFRGWRRNPRVFITFALAFILCFLLSEKAVDFAKDNKTTMQAVEAFIWTFDDSNSILLTSLLMIFLFSDMPFISSGTPFYLMRIDRKTWLTGQTLYIVLATGIYMAFILVATSLVCMNNTFLGNKWSQTAAILGYSGAGNAVALPSIVKTMEMSSPYACMGTIFLLMLFYALLMALIMLTFNILKGQLAGTISVFVFSLFGVILQPEMIATLFRLPDNLMYKANVAVGWLSPLNQATYHAHNFGYDLLPRLWQTYMIFGVVIVFFFLLALRSVHRYNFIFTGTEG